MDKGVEQSPWDELFKVSHTLSLRETVKKIDTQLGRKDSLKDKRFFSIVNLFR